MDEIIKTIQTGSELKEIYSKAISQERISSKEAIVLFEESSLGILGMIADQISRIKNGNKAYYIRNFHIEPTNVCIYNCQFCSYSQRITGTGWTYDLKDMKEMLEKAPGSVREVHITGGVHPDWILDDYLNIIKMIRETRPDLQIKAYSAVEYHAIFKREKISTEEGMRMFRDAGLDSIPGGGAEIFDPAIRKLIASKKAKAEEYLNVHRVAHQLGVPTNTTMLYGHIEKAEHRVHHLEQLRNLQDETSGFNAFIPLKFRNANNLMSDTPETSLLDDMKTYAISRIFLDNFQHIKAYWPMLGKDSTRLALQFGVDDVDGTISDSTKIYSYAGSEEQKPEMNKEEMEQLIRDGGKIPVERDSLYRAV